MDTKILSILLSLLNKKKSCSLKRSFCWKKLMNVIKNLFPFIATLGVFFLASNSEMQKKMNQYHSIDNEIKTISVEGFKPND